MHDYAAEEKEYLKEAKKRKSKGFAVVCDRFDFDHYPVFYGGPKDDYKTKSAVEKKYDGPNMQMIHEFISVPVKRKS
jgi:hypothetical protein